ncbi:MAG TPA: ATP-binding protein [Cytophagaceae bacterium]|nr:ATP-binding protein [Cytophagaceae bacterium]
MRRLKEIIACMFCCVAFFTTHAQTIQDILSEYDRNTDSTQKISLLIKLGLNYQNLHAYRKALDYYTQVLNMPSNEKTFVMKNAALCYEELHEYDKALGFWKEILEDKKAKSEHKEVITAMEKIANLSVQNNNYTQAIEYSLLLLPEYSMTGNKAGMASLYNNLGSLYKKTGDTKKSQEYFDKCRAMIDQKDSGINENDLPDILLNIGLTHTVAGEIDEANIYLARALLIREKQKKNVEAANILNYMAATDLIGAYYSAAKIKIDKALQYLKQAKDEPRYDEVEIASYRIYCELLLRKKKIKEFKYYNTIYNKLKDQLLAKEQKQNVVVLQQQVEIEKMESEIRLMQTEKDFFMRQSELEKDKKEKELIIQSKEIELLKQARDLQLTKIRNQELDKQRIAQLLELTNEKTASLEQKHAINQLQKNDEYQLFTIEKQSRENKMLALEKNAREQKLADEAVKRKYVMGLAMLLMVVVALIAWFLWEQKKNNDMLAKQNDIIQDNNQKIQQQNNELSQVNEELSQVNEELHMHRENLEMQNKELEKAKQTIASQNEELKIYNVNLENIVNSRTQELMNSNEKLIRNNSQLEQFGYVVSHNLRGPIARLLGLANIINKKAIDEENNLFLDKIVEVTKDLDLIIHDLNHVLEVQKGVGQEFVTVSFEEKTSKVLDRLENEIKEKKAVIRYDYSAAPEVKAVRVYVESILYNLISNALKYSKPAVVPQIHLGTKTVGDFIILTVSDNGIGIDMEKYKDKLFGLYKRFHTHVDGKGMGLYMIKTQLEVMGGKIEAESKLNEGSIFKAYFKK